MALELDISMPHAAGDSLPPSTPALLSPGLGTADLQLAGVSAGHVVNSSIRELVLPALSSLSALYQRPFHAYGDHSCDHALVGPSSGRFGFVSFMSHLSDS